MFLTYYTPLCKFVRHYVKVTEVAEELVQDVFTRVWEIRCGWNPHNAMKSYLYKAARNRALDYLKHRKVREKYEGEEVDLIAFPARSLDDELELKDFLSAAQEAIEQLPERCRLVYLLHHQDEFTYSEIAALLDISVKTVETHMVRALKILRRRLAPYLPSLDVSTILSEPFVKRP